MTEQYNGLSNKIYEYIETRKTDRLEKVDKEAEKKKRNGSEAELADLEQSLTEARRAEEERFIPKNWLTDAAQRAKQLNFVTHALKFVHPDARGTNLFAEYDDDTDKSFVSTASVDMPAPDVVGNAAALDVGKLLLLEYEGIPLIEKVRNNDISDLLPFADNQAQTQEWLEGFRKVLEPKELASHKLAKQVYWPTDNDSYHLLAPVFATSLTQEVYSIVQHSRYSEDVKALREKRKSNEYAEQPLFNYLNLATQSFGGTKPQNISQLNSQRGGKVYLFSNAPPTWEKQVKPPLYIQSIFSQYFERNIFYLIKPLKVFLEKNFNKENNRWIKDAREKGLDEILESIIGFASRIQAMTPGWSEQDECHLPEEEKLWLDPGRAQYDDDFHLQRDRDEWQHSVADNFARWLGKKLESPTLALGAAEHRELRDLLKPELRLNLKNIPGVWL